MKHQLPQEAAIERIGCVWSQCVVDLVTLQTAFTAVLFLIVAMPGICDETQPPLKSGPEVGSTVVSFYVRAVTGPFAGKSVCYVCRNGDRPVVIVFLREIGPDATRLLKQLDATVNLHRAEGLRCFVVLFSEASQRDSARLQTLAFDEKLDIPLTLATETLSGAMTKNIAPNVVATVVLYEHLKVIDQFSYRPGECDEAACNAVTTAAKQLATGSPAKRPE